MRYCHVTHQLSQYLDSLDAADREEEAVQDMIQKVRGVPWPRGLSYTRWRWENTCYAGPKSVTFYTKASFSNILRCIAEKELEKLADCY